jgi:hypothetical protein
VGDPAGRCPVKAQPNETKLQESSMSNTRKTIVAFCLVAFAAACAPQPEPVYVEPVPAEPVYSGKM